MMALWLIGLVLPVILAVPVPEQIHIAIGKDANSMVVNWVTMEPAGTPHVRYGTNAASLDQIQDGVTDDFEYEGIHRYMHAVTLKNLQPGKIYYYKVGTSASWSRQLQFKSFPAGEFELRVCVFGDLGYYNGTSLPYLIAAAENDKFDMVIHVGDIGYDLHSEKGVRGDKYMREMEPLVSRVPYMVIAGNHEDDQKNFSHYHYRFTMPNYDNQFYSFDLSTVHFVGVSTEYYGSFYLYGHQPVMNQYAWLQDDLKKADANRANIPWIISFQHRPFYCSNDNSFECRAFENTLVRVGYEEMPGLESIFDEYGMDFGFWGHEHSYERLLPVFNRTVYNNSGNPYHNARAPSYIVSGSAGCHTPKASFGPPSPASAFSYERLLPVFNRTVYNSSGNPYHNARAPSYIVSGSAGCHTPKASFGPPSPASAFRSDDFGYTLMTVYNKTHIHIQQISVEKNETPIDDIWLVKDFNYRMTKENATGVPFPPAIYNKKCSFRDATCRRNAETYARVARSYRSYGFVE
uniref:Purple acid phosphatase n=1 Tax=Panagrolaimus sp. JU765 TaxID=591449 RepID=A0AC34QEB1_9BILA